MNFEFAGAGRLVFGRGRAGQVPALSSDLGRRALVVLGASDRGGDALRLGLDRAGVASVTFHVPGEPSIHLVDEATRIARAGRCDLVIAQGGGSVIDAGKAVAGLLGNPGGALDYLELVGGGKSLANPGAPFVAVPTTAGTGAEVTRNAVLDVPEHEVKVSLRSHHLLARLAVVDPDLTLSMPPEITAYTGMDALTQLIEPLVSRAANPLTDGLCREGLSRAARSLEGAYRDGTDPAARADMAVASVCGGIALANARLGAVHGLAGALGGATGHPHGALCARLLPFVMAANIRAAEERGDPETNRRYAEIARTLTGDLSATPLDGVARVHDLCAALMIPPLRSAGLSPADFDRLLPVARRASSMQGNPVEFSDGELREILESAI